MANDASETKTEGQKEENSSVCCKMCTRKRQTRYLPQEMVFHILSHVPAQVLHDVMRHVCKEWNLMIRNPDFIRHHLRNSTTGIIIQDVHRYHNGVYVEMRRGRLEICKFDCRFGDLVWTSCNGIVLTLDFLDLHILYVTNPLTKQRAFLPPYFHEIRFLAQFCLAFVETSMEYKVVCACRKESFVLADQIAVLTIGVDKVWRRIDIKHLFLPTEVPSMISFPFVTGGYVHWIAENFVLTLNVETETVWRFPKPQLPESCGRFLPMGGNLSFVSESHDLLMDAWEMNAETGEWTMLPSFDLEPLRYIFQDLFCEDAELFTPLGWLAVREVLVFISTHLPRRCIAYNVDTREIQSFELDASTKRHHLRAHVNSLVWL